MGRQGAMTGAVALVLLAGCGGDSSEGGGGGDSAADAKRAVTRFVDTDDCKYASDDFVQEIVPEASSVDDARKRCTADTSTKGLQKGEYEVRSARVLDDSRARVVLALNTGSSRTYEVVRESGEWRARDFKETSSATKHKLGTPVKFADSYEEVGGKGVDVRLTVTALSFKQAPAPEYAALDKSKRGKTWYRLQAEVTSKSSGAYPLSPGDFQVRDGEGQSYEAGVDYQPALANTANGVNPGETVKGFLSFNLPKGTKPAAVLFAPGVSDGLRITWLP